MRRATAGSGAAATIRRGDLDPGSHLASSSAARAHQPTKRSDYNAPDVENRHTIVPGGWTHEQEHARVGTMLPSVATLAAAVRFAGCFETSERNGDRGPAGLRR